MKHASSILFEIYQSDAGNLLAIDERNIAFWKMLSKFVPRPKNENPPYLILDVACGECEEARVLCAYFSSGIQGIPNQNAKLYALDLDREALERALALIKIPLPSDLNPRFVLLPAFQLVYGDATQLTHYDALPLAFDFALIRHQFALMDSKFQLDVWTQIFKQTLAKLKPGSLLLSTSFSKKENGLLLERVGELDATLELNEKNPFAIPYGPKYPDVAFDQFITILKRKP